MIVFYFIFFIFATSLLFIVFSLIFLFTNIKKYYLNIKILLIGSFFAFFIGLILIGIMILIDIVFYIYFYTDNLLVI